MAQQDGSDEMESVRIQLSNIGRSVSTEEVQTLRTLTSFDDDSDYDDDDDDDDEYESQWAAVERLPLFERITTALFDDKVGRKRLVNVTKLGPDERHCFIDKLIKHVQNDNLSLAGVQLPSVEVRYKNLSVQAECQLVHGKPLPTLWNATKGVFSGISNLLGSKQEAKISILKDVNGIIKPGRMTLLLGPPGCGKTTFLLALAGKLSQTLEVSGEITYNGYGLDEFNPRKTSTYVSQYDLHTPEMTVRETLDFSARFQEVSQREKQAGIVPDPDVDAYMKAISVEGTESTLQTDYILKILGLDNCADTMVGDAIRRGISGGEKKRLTTVSVRQKFYSWTKYRMALIVSTSFQKGKLCIIMALALIFTNSSRIAGLGCLERKGIADFIQEVISRKDQAQYWYHKEQPYRFVSVNHFIQKFKECKIGVSLEKELSDPLEKTQSRRDSLSFKRREFLLMKRNSFLYVFKTLQLLMGASMTMTVFLRTRMARELCFYPAWAYAIPAAILKIPLSFLESFLLISLTYYTIGYSPEVGRNVHVPFNFLGVPNYSCFYNCWHSCTSDYVILRWLHRDTTIYAFLVKLGILAKSGIIWGDRHALNELLAPRWEKVKSGNTTAGQETLESRGLNFDSSFYCSAPGKSRAMVSFERYYQLQGQEDSRDESIHNESKIRIETDSFSGSETGKMVLPFQPLTVAFRDVQYYVNIPMGFKQKKVQLLSDITGAFRPGEIRIGGYLKVQDAYARVSGYCEQTDMHTPHLTVEESLIYSAWLRLPSYIDSETKARKRLTIAVELVANPSIMFMDEPTTGLDARAAAIVMRAVKNVVETGRTVVCTIHQPSIHIFEAFDELILMKTGGRIIYSGPLEHPGVPKIKDKYNPATWMLDVTSKSAEAQTSIDFADVYGTSTLYKENIELVKQLSSPPPDSKELEFPTRFPQNGWEQFKACLWEQHLSYWRSPSYNLARFFSSLSHLLSSAYYSGREEPKCQNNQQDLFNALGRTVMYREMFAVMYSSWAYSFAQVIIEIPYLAGVALLYVMITYPMIGFYWSAYKVLWSFYTMFCSLLCFTYLGMMIVSLTPNTPVAFIMASSSYSVLNLFSGFYMPRPVRNAELVGLAIYLTPTSWSLNSIFTSQYGDIDKEIHAFGETTTVSAFLENYFGYHHTSLGSVAIVLIIFPVVLALLFAYFIGKLNFQRS
ncbi:hypothetical protein CXB51_025543 [Gossypium anomalum]|uniref:AAA+ ATPase domain-containing protein n=1 Tax=Gossypium anomalum TaxID=47600 RepID=A0A8J5YAE0_9ROSI|nr:hypothetical protein CXB51_025543 [Gossypium anomalum]